MFQGDSHRMSRKVVEKMIADYLSLQFPVSVFSWQGGEPTLCGLDFFQEVVRLQMKYGRKGQRVSNTFQTNGFLLNGEWCRFFNKYFFFVGISIDGPEKIHDFYRGKGSWEKVMKAVNLLKEYKVEFNVLSVLTRKSEGKAREIFNFFLDNGIRYLQFIPCLEKEEKRIAPYSITPEGYGNFLIELFDLWWKERERVSIRLFDSLLEKLITGENKSFCPLSSTCGNYVVVEHDGSVYPCDFFVRKEWLLGNIMERNLVEIYESPKKKRFNLNKRFLSPECEECPYQEFCYGGCQKDRIDEKGNPSAKTYFCVSYRIFFSHALPRLKRYALEISRKSRK